MDPHIVDTPMETLSKSTWCLFFEFEHASHKKTAVKNHVNCIFFSFVLVSSIVPSKEKVVCYKPG